MELDIFTDFSSLKNSQTSDWLFHFMNKADDAFANSSDHARLLGNLLIMDRYINTLRQGLSTNNLEISPGLEYARTLLWNYLKGQIAPIDFQNFTNDYYACLYAYNVGNIDTDAPKDFYNKYFAGTSPDSYELLAVEWSSNLLVELVAMAGGHLDFDEFYECSYSRIDFYGIDIMINILEDAGIELTGTPCVSNQAKDFMQAKQLVHQTPFFQEIIRYIQKDLKTALNATPNQYASLQKEYEQYTIIPQKYAAELLEY